LTGEALSLPPGFLWVVVVGFGAIFGSFLNVVIHRLPRMEGYWAELEPLMPLPVVNRHPIEVGDHTVAEPLPVVAAYTLAWPPSTCPKCETRIAWYDNVPVLSWFVLGGKCRSCKNPISFRYPLIEAATAGIFGGLYGQYGLTPVTAGMIALSAAMVAIFWIDVDFMIIPDSISLPMIWSGLLFHALLPTGLGAARAVGGAALGYLLFRAIEEFARRVLKREGMGRGDAKLAAMMGAWLGPQLLAAGLFIGFLVGSVSGLVVEIIRRRLNFKAAWKAVLNHDTRPFPFGPSLVVGGFASMFAGDRLLNWYFGLMRV
jgi:leader peptidase (prepilin peptidase)/N-methyltransferase